MKQLHEGFFCIFFSPKNHKDHRNTDQHRHHKSNLTLPILSSSMRRRSYSNCSWAVSSKSPESNIINIGRLIIIQFHWKANHHHLGCGGGVKLRGWTVLPPRAEMTRLSCYKVINSALSSSNGEQLNMLSKLWHHISFPARYVMQLHHQHLREEFTQHL